MGNYGYSVGHDIPYLAQLDLSTKEVTHIIAFYKVHGAYNMTKLSINIYMYIYIYIYIYAHVSDVPVDQIMPIKCHVDEVNHKSPLFKRVQILAQKHTVGYVQWWV